MSRANGIKKYVSWKARSIPKLKLNKTAIKKTIAVNKNKLYGL